MNRIAIVLRQKNLPQERIASHLNTTAATVNRWCRNISQPNWDALRQIADYMYVDVRSLIYYEPFTAIAAENSNTYDFSKIGSGDILLHQIEGINISIHELLDLSILEFAEYPGRVTYSEPIDLVMHPNSSNVAVITVNRIIQECQYTILKFKNRDVVPFGIKLHFQRSLNSESRRVCPICQGTGDQGGGFFHPGELPPESVPCQTCRGTGFVLFEANKMSEIRFSQAGFHNRHIYFRLKGSDELYSGAIWDGLHHGKKEKNSIYCFIPTNKMKAYKRAQANNEFDVAQKMVQKIDIEDITWAKRVDY